MITTIEDAEAELIRIDSELERLRLERRNVLSVLELLRRQAISPPRSYRMRPLLSVDKQRLYDIVRDNPGIDGRGIFEIFGDENHRRLSFRLSEIRQAGLIENRGGRGRAARWFALEIEE